MPGIDGILHEPVAGIEAGAVGEDHDVGLAVRDEFAIQVVAPRVWPGVCRR